MSIEQLPLLVEQLRIKLEQGGLGGQELTQTLLEKVMEYYGSLRATADAKREMSSAEEALERARAEHVALVSELVKVEDEYLGALSAIIDIDEGIIVNSWLEGKDSVPSQFLIAVYSDLQFLTGIYQEYRNIWRNRLTKTMNSCTEAEAQDTMVKKLDGIDAQERLDIRFLNVEVVDELVDKIRKHPTTLTAGEIKRAFKRARVLEVYTMTPPELIVESALCPIRMPLGVRKKMDRR